MRPLKLAAVLLTVAALASACSIRTAGSPKGDLELTATFDDVSNLVVGHSVQVADVTIGTVTHIDLVDGRRARVTMSIEDGQHLPVGTTAVLDQTSILGEQYVELRPPADRAGGGPLLHSGDEIERTQISPDFETVTERAIDFLGAIGTQDVNTLVSTGARAIGGRGRDLHQLLRELSTVVIDLDSQRAEIVQTIDGFAAMADDLADGSGNVVTLLDDLSSASATLARNRTRIIGALEGIRDMTQITNQAVLDQHMDTLISTIRDLDPIIQTLADQRPELEQMMEDINLFLRGMDDNVSHTSTAAQAQYVWARGITTPSGNLGEQEQQGGPSLPELPALPVDPRNVQADVQHLLDALLGFLGNPTNLRLPVEVCRQLESIGVVLDQAITCGDEPQQPPTGPGQPVTDPEEALDQVLGGLPG